MDFRLRQQVGVTIVGDPYQARSVGHTGAMPSAVHFATPRPDSSLPRPLGFWRAPPWSYLKTFGHEALVRASIMTEWELRKTG